MILSPLPIQRFYDNNNNPAVKGQLFTYVAGTTTKQATYLDAAGTPNTNPIILDFRGEGSIWLDPTLTYKFVFAPANDTDPPANPFWTVDNISSLYSGTIDWTQIVYDQTDAELAAGVTPVNTNIPHHNAIGIILPERYGAVGNGNSADLVNAALDTAAIISAITLANTINCPIVLSRAYIAIPGTAQSGAATYNCAFALKNNLTFIGHNSASIKMQDGYSTNGSPKEMAMFSTSVGVANISWIGLTMDMNGANNLMSPSRPASYNQFNHAAIMANGPTGLINTARIEDCTIKNNAGVCFVVCQLVEVGGTPTLGVNWIIRNNLFLNGGSDTNDHTSVYGFAEEIVCQGNTFWEDSPPHTVGLTGGATCYEVHGANQRFVDNYCYNYTLGMYVAPNFTNPTVNTVVSNNHFFCSDYGILIWRGVALGYAALDDILISDNTFYFNNYTYSGQPLYRACIAYQGQISTAQGAVNNIKICDNIAIATGTTLLSNFVRWDSSTTASNLGSNLSITDNQVFGFTNGVYIVTNATNGMGYTEVSRNKFISLTPDTLANPPIGIFVNATGAIETLTIDDNQFIDERGSPSMQYGIYLQTGTITTLFLGQQIFKGMTAANANNAGATITNQLGMVATEGANNISDGGAITFNADYTGFTPKAIFAQTSIAGESAQVTTFGASTFTVAIKKWTGGVLTAGSTQTIYWRVRF